jgi:hypothetical protein
MRTILKAGLVLLILAVSGSLSACAARPGPGQQAAIRAVFDQARRHDFAAIETRLAPRLRTAVTDTRLQAQAALIPDQPPRAVKPVRFVSARANGGEETSALDEYFYADRLLVVSTAIRTPPGAPPQVLAFNIQPFSLRALAVGRFTLAGKSTTQYFLLGVATGIPLLLVYALARLARDRTTRWKWLWTPFILIGFTELSVNWATGALVFQPFSLLLLGASVARPPLDVAPWIVTVSLPLGAVIYLGRVWFAARPEEME